MLFQFHIGDTVHKQAANPVGALKHRHLMAAPVKLIRHSKPRRAAPHHSYALTGAHLWRIGRCIAFLISIFNDGILVLLGGDWLVMQAAGAGRLAQRRAHTGGKLREIIGLMQTVVSLFPVPCINQIVPLRHQIVQRTAGSHAAQGHARLAKRHAAVHTTGALLLLLLHRQMLMKFVKILYALFRTHIL